MLSQSAHECVIHFIFAIFKNSARPGPARPDFGPARPVAGWQISGPGPARPGPARPGPARPGPRAAQPVLSFSLNVIKLYKSAVTCCGKLFQTVGAA